MKTGIKVNLCDHCPITAATTCSLQRIAFERFRLDGMSKCETYDDIVRMLEVMKDNKSRVIDNGSNKGRIRKGSLSPDMARLRRA